MSCRLFVVLLGAEQELDFLMFNSPPVEVLFAFEDDCIGVYFNMLCPKLDLVFYFFDASFFNQKKDIYIYIYIPLSSSNCPGLNHMRMVWIPYLQIYSSPTKGSYHQMKIPKIPSYHSNRLPSILL